MTRVALLIGLVVPAVLLAPGTAPAQTRTHNCGFCHDLHGGSYAQLTTAATSEAVCQSCHGDAGPATVDRDGVPVAVPKDVAIHNGARHPANGATTCWSCHDHEGEAGGNLAMVPRSLRTPGSGTRTVVFTARTGSHSFADGDATYDGVCEVCHTLTDYHRTDATGDHAHNAAADCTPCHTHRSGFQAAGGCTQCHNQPQDNGDNLPPGGRRAVVGEFARRSHHVLVSPADSIPDADCQVCHDMSRHQQGAVRLGNVDNGAVVALAGDPNTVSAEAAKLAPVCLACHDANGAAGDVTPFTDNVTRPPVDSVAWVASSHGTAPVLAGCYGDGTTGCHASGHGSLKKRLLAPPAVGPISPDSAVEQEGFCYGCHDGTPATNVQAELFKGTNTSTVIYHHPVVNSQQPSGRPVECVSCHNTHVARADAAAPTAPAASGRLLGVARVAVTNGAAGTVPTYTYRTATDPAPAREYEICFACHSSYVTQPAGQTNLAVILNPANASYHPVEAPGKNTNINANAFVNGWTAVSTMYCTDCHTSDNAAVRGPHGSVNRYILKLPYTASSASRTMTSGEQCFDCHNYNVYANDQSTTTVKGYSRFNDPGFDRGHTFHVDQHNRPCYACHASHGSATRPHLIVTGRSPGLNDYVETGTGGTCSPTCHGTETYSLNYAR